MDNIGNLAGLVAIGVQLRGRRRHQPDSSLAGRSCDRLGVQPDRWPTTHGLSGSSGKTHWVLARLRPTFAERRRFARRTLSDAQGRFQGRFDQTTRSLSREAARLRNNFQ